MNADVIVLGLGGMGAATAATLARRGLSVVGFEQYPLVHNRGSSHGHTRIIRTAYYEHPAYVPLVRRAFALWHELEQRTGQHLLTACPCLNIGAKHSDVVTGVLAAAHEHNLDVESLNAVELVQRYPQFRVPHDYLGILESASGFLYVEKCVEAWLDEARDHEAELYAEMPVRSWRATASGVEVVTDHGVHSAAKLVIAAGGWATELLADIGVPLTVMRQVLQWFNPGPMLPKFARDRFPIFLLETPAGAFYGLPALDRRGVKVAQHYGAPELPNPAAVDWTTTDADREPVSAFLAQHLPDAGLQSRAEVCLYTLTPDRHFVIDRHPHDPHVAIAAGFSGHGFKFVPTVAEILADLTMNGRTSHDISLFQLARFAQ